MLSFHLNNHLVPTLFLYLLALLNLHPLRQVILFINLHHYHLHLHQLHLNLLFTLDLHLSLQYLLLLILFLMKSILTIQQGLLLIETYDVRNGIGLKINMDIVVRVDSLLLLDLIEMNLFFKHSHGIRYKMNYYRLTKPHS